MIIITEKYDIYVNNKYLPLDIKYGKFTYINNS